MEFDNNEPFSVIHRIGCLWAFSSSELSLCSSGVHYGGRKPKPAYILINGAHCGTVYRYRFCLGYLSFSVILKSHSGFSTLLLTAARLMKNVDQDEGNHLIAEGPGGEVKRDQIVFTVNIKSCLKATKCRMTFWVSSVTRRAKPLIAQCLFSQIKAHQCGLFKYTVKHCVRKRESKRQRQLLNYFFLTNTKPHLHPQAQETIKVFHWFIPTKYLTKPLRSSILWVFMYPHTHSPGKSRL